MIGIRNIEFYIPDQRRSNYEKKEKFGLTDEFIENKLGIGYVSRMRTNQDTSDLCRTAYQKLLESGEIDSSKIEALVVCTQNPDYHIPHTSAILHGKLNLPERCATFDISLGCSGYVYGLSLVQGFMASNGMREALFFTADPYSKIVDQTDKNTAVLFGDAATVTHISGEYIYKLGKFTFGTRGKAWRHLICENGKLRMNGREIFNFVASTIPADIMRVLEINKLSLENIDRFIIHQGSKFIVDFIAKRLGLPQERIPFVTMDYGNTVSSSIPIILTPLMKEPSANHVLISGFGVGLSWASGVLFRKF